MSLLDIKEFIFELPLYTKIKIDSTNVHSFYALMGHKHSFDEYNPSLRQETTYQIIRNPNYSVSPTKFKQLQSYEGIKEFEVMCVRNGLIITVFAKLLTTYIDVDEKEVEYHYMKVGQYPSIADLHISKIKEYNTVLPRDKMKEITKAIGLAANGVGIGSFVYLRRVFEFLIEEAHEIAKNDNDWDEDTYFKSRVAEKINLLKHHLPNFLVDNRSIYSILSLGIHELEENECLKHFDALKVGIELILDEKVEQLIKIKKIESAKKRIQGIAQQIKK